MRTNFGFVDAGFRPSIMEWAGSVHGDYLKAWKIDTASPMVAGVHAHDRKAAVWIGRAASKFGDSPIIAVSIGLLEVEDFFQHHWYTGIYNFSWDKGEFGKAGSQLELASLALENAFYGPSQFHEAISSLKVDLPSSSIVSAV